MNCEILPWNGYVAALSLTFDDGDPSHIDSAIPLLDQYSFKGTFFIITSAIQKWSKEEKEKWCSILKNGHEIGSHTVTHPHPQNLSYAESLNMIKNAKDDILKEFKVYPFSFAYPFGEITDFYRKILPKFHIASRGGGGDFYISFDSELDFFNIPSQTTLTHLDIDTYKRWITTAISNRAWTVFMIHGIEGTPWGWEPIPKKTFVEILEILKSLEKEIWIATFGEVSAYMKAAKIVKKALNKTNLSGKNKIVLKWKKPKPFPSGVNLKIKTDENFKVFQNNLQLSSENGIYTVSFDKENLLLCK